MFPQAANWAILESGLYELMRCVILKRCSFEALFHVLDTLDEVNSGFTKVDVLKLLI
jgi:hypothetical protein